MVEHPPPGERPVNAGSKGQAPALGRTFKPPRDTDGPPGGVRFPVSRFTVVIGVLLWLAVAGILVLIVFELAHLFKR
jgi:hypothetical protein